MALKLIYIQIYMGMTYAQPSILASEEWCTVPYLQQGKRPLDKLGDILLQFPRIYAARNNMRKQRAQERLSDPLGYNVETQAQELITRLQTYWQECRDLISPGYDYSNFAERTNFETVSSKWIIEITVPITYRDPFVATSVAMYDAATVLANSLVWQSGARSIELYKQRIVIHCASILQAAVYHESQGPNSGGSIQMVFPLKVICRVTPSDDQRQQAEIALARWGENRGVDGICDPRVIPQREGISNAVRVMEAA